MLTPAGLDATIYDSELMVLAVEVTSPSNAWTDRVAKPDAYARAGVPHYLRVDLDQGVDQVAASAYTLTPGGAYLEATRSGSDGRLLLDRPFPVELDLPVLARATRHHGRRVT